MVRKGFAFFTDASLRPDLLRNLHIFLQFLRCFQIVQKSFTSGNNISVGFIKSVAVPRVRDAAPRTVRKIQQQLNLVIRVRPCNADGVPDVVGIRAEKIIVVGVILPRHLSGALTAEIRVSGIPYMMFSQFCLCRRINRIAFPVPDLLCAGSGGGILELILDAALLHHVLEDEFGHGGTTDVAVADEKYSNHKNLLS